MMRLPWFGFHSPKSIGEAAKIRWRTGGDWSCPMVLRTAYGGGFRGGPYHSQSVEAYYAHAPGLKVVAPSTPADAKGLLIAAIRDPDPVLVLEHKRTYRAIRGNVPEGDYVVMKCLRSTPTSSRRSRRRL